MSNNSKVPYYKPWFKNKNKSTPNSSSKSRVKSVHNYDITPVHGYYGFKLYFATEDAVDNQKILKDTSTFTKYVKRNSEEFSLVEIRQYKKFMVNLNKLEEDEQFINEWNDFGTDITSDTEHCLSCMGLAVHQLIMKDLEKSLNNDQTGEIQTLPDLVPVIRARLTNHQPILQLKNLKVHYYGKLVSIRGTVIRAGTVRLKCHTIAFKCSNCLGTQVVKQSEGKYMPPIQCPSKGCRVQSKFIPLLCSPYTKTVDLQTLKLQELVGTDQAENGRVPRTIECELTEDLVNCCVPGDDVTITGVIKVQNTNEANTKNKQASIFLLYIEAVSVVNNKNRNQAITGNSAQITFNTLDYYAIQKIHAEPALFKLLVQSLCPSIYGHEIVKAGLLLALFGGTQNEIGTRIVSHVLVVGDPGLGKSQMLKACTNVSPRGVYVCGNTSTNSGLTVTVTRESGEYALEAGALVLADQGSCCIDEFDKMTTQHACLLEVMEQQSISIAKAGVTCSLPTRASVLAAANPIGGHYNKAKTVAENLKMGSALLSRFDLVFILLDQPNEQHDVLLSEHILALHSGVKKKRSSSTQSNSTVSSTPEPNAPLKIRLQLSPREAVDHLPHPIFRKYIAYAQKYVHPQLSQEAKTVLKQFYLELRKRFQTGDCTPVTTRQLESLVRLTQARAKLELREAATAADAIDVVEIMRNSLVDVFTDEFGVLDFKRSQNGSGMSSRNKIKALLSRLQVIAKNQTRSIFSFNELQGIAEQQGIGKDKFYDTIQSLNVQGFLLKKGGGSYQLTSVDF